MKHDDQLKITLPDGYAELEKYVDSEDERKIDIFYYVLLNCPELIADIDSLRDLLSKMSYHDQAVMVQRLLKAKAYIDSNRSHIKGKSISPVEAFETIFGREIFENVSNQLIENGYTAINSIKISNEKITAFQKESRNALCSLRNLFDSDEFIFKTIYLFFSAMNRNVSVQEILEFLPQQSEEYYKETVEILQNVIKSIHRKKNETALLNDLFCANCYASDNDNFVETTLIFNQVVSCLKKNIDRNSQDVVLINPSPVFVKTFINNWYASDFSLLVVCERRQSVLYNLIYKRLGSRFSSVSFDELENHPEFKNSIFSHAVLFANRSFCDASKYEIVECFLNKAKENSVLQVLDSDNDLFADYSNFKKIFMRNGYHPEQILLLPAGIKPSTPLQRKSFVCYRKKEKNLTDEVKIIKFKLQFHKEDQYLVKDGTTCFSAIQDIEESTTSPRYLIREALFSGESKNSRTRKGAYIYPFSKEIEIKYTASISANVPRVSAYVMNAGGFDEAGSPIKTNRSILKSTTKSTKKISQDNLQDWLENQYPFEKNKGEKVIEIRDEISKEYLKAYDHRPISLKTFLYIHREFEEEHCDSLTTEQLWRVARSDLGETNISRLYSPCVNEILEQIYSEPQEDSLKRRVKKYLSLLVDYAIKVGNARENYLAEEVKEEQNDRTPVYGIKNNLQRRSFRVEECKEVYMFLLSEIKRGNKEYLALMIGFLTGVDSNAVCALTWNDFIEIDEYEDKFYCFVIAKKLSNDGNSIQSLSSKEQYRYVPSPKILTEILLQEYENGKVTDKGEPIAYSQSKTTDLNEKKALAPVQYRKLQQKIFKKIGYVENTIYAPTKDGKTIQTDLSKYQADIFVSNYRHHAIHICQMEEGELAYLSGLSAPYTFARNYCDYGNDASKLILYIKQNRFADCLVKKGSEMERRVADCDFLQEYVTLKNGGRIELMAYMNIPNSCTVKVNSKYGFDLTIQKVVEEI